MPSFKYNVTFADDLRNPAYRLSVQAHHSGVAMELYIKFILVDVLQLHRNGILAWLFIVHIAGAVGSQICVAVLKV